jgi:CDP-diglyceride synthetase
MNLPPFVANSLMPLAKYLPRNYPLDFRRNFRDGKRILGEHKTFGGLIIGSMGGSLIGYAANLDMSYSFLSSPLSIAGDSIGSFIKRRLGKREGENFPLVDRTVWLTIYPLLYQHLNQKSISEFLGLYAITLIVGYGLHKFANDLIPKITNYIELKVNKTNSQMNEG